MTLATVKPVLTSPRYCNPAHVGSQWQWRVWPSNTINKRTHSTPLCALGNLHPVMEFLTYLQIRFYFLLHFLKIHTLCVGGGKLYSAGSDQAIISWNLENLTLHKKIEVCCTIIASSFLWQAGCNSYLLEKPLLCPQNAHDNIICAIVYNGKYLFTSSHSCIKVS